MDSALRGNVSAELKAVSDHFGQESIGFVPAFPDYKRSVRQGKLYIEEVLVSQSVFWAIALSALFFASGHLGNAGVSPMTFFLSFVSLSAINLG